MKASKEHKPQQTRTISLNKKRTIQCLFISNRVNRLLNNYDVPNQCITFIQNATPPRIEGNTMYFWNTNGNDVYHITSGIGHQHRTVFFTYMNGVRFNKAVILGIGLHINNQTYRLLYSSNGRNQVILGGNRQQW